MAEHLPNRGEALGLTSSTAKRTETPAKLFSKVNVPFHIPTTYVTHFHILHILANHVVWLILRILDIFNRSVVITHHSFNLHLSMHMTKGVK